LLTGTPVIARRGRRLRDAASQSESRQRHRATYEHARRPANPRSRLPDSRHLPEFALAGLRARPKPLVAQGAAPKLAVLCDRSTGSHE
jgi:hypothetical protein